MGSLSPAHWVIILIVVMLLFGSGRVSNLMGDVAKGIKNFKEGLADDSADAASKAKPAARIEAQADQPVSAHDEAKL